MFYVHAESGLFFKGLNFEREVFSFIRKVFRSKYLVGKREKSYEAKCLSHKKHADATGSFFHAIKMWWYV